MRWDGRVESGKRGPRAPKLTWSLTATILWTKKGLTRNCRYWARLWLQTAKSVCQAPRFEPLALVQSRSKGRRHIRLDAWCKDCILVLLHRISSRRGRDDVMEGHILERFEMLTLLRRRQLEHASPRLSMSAGALGRGRYDLAPLETRYKRCFYRSPCSC